MANHIPGTETRQLGFLQAPHFKNVLMFKWWVVDLRPLQKNKKSLSVIIVPKIKKEKVIPFPFIPIIFFLH
ncbi:hypothetical protein GCM10020331_010380 [Ectobacillus funiculus]